MGQDLGGLMSMPSAYDTEGNIRSYNSRVRKILASEERGMLRDDA